MGNSLFFEIEVSVMNIPCLSALSTGEEKSSFFADPN